MRRVSTGNDLAGAATGPKVMGSISVVSATRSARTLDDEESPEPSSSRSSRVHESPTAREELHPKQIVKLVSMKKRNTSPASTEIRSAATPIAPISIARVWTSTRGRRPADSSRFDPELGTSIPWRHPSDGQKDLFSSTPAVAATLTH